MRRSIAFVVVTLVCLTAAGGVFAAPKLTSKNSVTYKLYTASTERFLGVNCGTTATIVKTLPTGSTGIKVVAPKVGDTDQPSASKSGTQITGVAVNGTTITLSAIANGPYAPGEPVYWKGDFKFEADYSRRIPTVIRVYYESYMYGAKWKNKPRTIQDSRKGTPRSVRSRYVNLKWKSFGGKKAIATGKAKLDYCSSGGGCPNNNARVRLVATKPRFCRNSGQFEYLNLKIYYHGRLSSEIPIRCQL
jgi:hypothetical protein